MPSSKKKQSKRQSEMSCPSPRTPSMASSVTSEISDDCLLRTLEVASDIFPSLIGKTAFVGRVTDIGHSPRGNTVWLSESAMVSASFAHGSLVSVSLPSNSNLPRRFPLRSFSDGFADHTGVHFRDQFTDEAGNFFAFAKICSSIKVSKDEMRLSSDLASTMGYPTVGDPVFVYPAHSENLLVTKAIPLSLFDCDELYLELVHSGASTTTNVSSRNSSGTSNGPVNGSVGSASPRTPMNQIKASSSVKNQLASPVGGSTVGTLPNINGQSIDLSDIKKLFSDKGSAKQLLDRCAAHWLNNRRLLRGNFVTIPVLSELCTFRVVGAKQVLKERAGYHLMDGSESNFPPEVSEHPEQFIQSFVVLRETKVCLALENPEKQGPSCVTSDKADNEEENSKLGGLSKEYGILQDIIVSLSTNFFSSFGLRNTKGVLLHGPPGTGKTSLAQLCVRDAGLKIFPLWGTELVSKYLGESERSLHQVFEAAHKAAPAVVFIDDVDAIAPGRNEGGDELSQRMVATLLNLMDGIGTTEGILVIATTSRPDSIDSALRRPGRFDREIEIGVPSPKQRIDILRSLLDNMNHSLSESQVENLALTAHGFVGADLAALCEEAATICLRHYIKFQENLKDYNVVDGSYYLNDRGNNLSLNSDSASSSMSNGMILYENINGAAEESMLKIGFECFETAKTRVIPSAMREVVLEVPEVRWEDVGGQTEVKRQLIEAVEWPQKHRESLKRIGTRPPRGVLMFGPPGCSKTLLARAVASQARLNFLAVKGPELFSKWVGDSEKGVRNLFAKARANAPSIIFFDEIDGLASIRGHENDGVSVPDRVMSQLLVEMDGLHERLDVTVIAATNRPDKIDSALLRPGRFDRLLYVGPPNESDRAEIFRIHLRKIPCSSDVSIEDLASLAQGYTGADISSVCREAAFNAMEGNENASEITMQDLRIGIEKVLPSTSHISYPELSKEFERLVLST